MHFFMCIRKVIRVELFLRDIEYNGIKSFNLFFFLLIFILYPFIVVRFWLLALSNRELILIYNLL